MHIRISTPSLHSSASGSDVSAPPAPRTARQVWLSPADNTWRGHFFAMGSPCEVLVDSPSRSDAAPLAETAAAEAWRIEDKFSRYRAGTIVDRINSAGGETVRVDDETARLLDFAATLYASSAGRFDITSGVLGTAWKFDGSDRVPDPGTIEALLVNVGWNRVTWHAPDLTLPAGMQIDLGGIGKEYAVDQAVARLRGLSDQRCLVNFGGDLAVTGPPRRRRAWQVGVEATDGTSRIPSRLIHLETGALATSGDTRRYVVHAGKRYGHILDPGTGWPVQDAPASVTVAADTCVAAGVYATFAMLEGRGAEAFLRGEKVRHWTTRH